MKTSVSCLAIALTLLTQPALAADGKQPKAAPAKAPAAKAVLAKAGAITVTRAEFESYVQRESHTTVDTVPEAKRRALLSRLVVRKALGAKAEQEGLGRDPALAKGMLRWQMQIYPTLYWERLVDRDVKVSEKELREYADPQPEYKLAAINFGLDEDAVTAANEVYKSLLLGADFADAARTHSIGLASRAGGEIGWQTLPSKFVEASETSVVQRTKVGGITPPLQTRAGVVIFKVLEVHSADEVFKRERKRWLDELLPERIQQARDRRLAELRAMAKISYPAQEPGAAPDAPDVIIDGLAFSLDTPDQREHASFIKSIQLPEDKVRKLVDAYVIVRDALRRGLDKDPDLDVAYEIERTEQLVNLLLRKETQGRFKVSDEELRAEYQRYYVPEIYELQAIVTTDKSRAAEALARLKEGADFAAVSKQYGVGRLAPAGGSLPAGPIVDYPAPVRAAIEAVGDGGTTGVLELAEGQWVIIRRVRKGTVAVPPFEQVASSIRARLTVRQRSSALEEYVENFRKGLKITIDEELLRKL
jgi:parvulin-like peptidyl-prolyl isomerase